MNRYFIKVNADGVIVNAASHAGTEDFHDPTWIEVSSMPSLIESRKCYVEGQGVVDTGLPQRANGKTSCPPRRGRR
jgi:hypothetical protein